jgi:predicted type IV restriction endonuclease
VTGGRRWLILDEHEGAKLLKKKVWLISLNFFREIYLKRLETDKKSLPTPF